MYVLFVNLTYIVVNIFLIIINLNLFPVFLIYCP